MVSFLLFKGTSLLASRLITSLSPPLTPGGKNIASGEVLLSRAYYVHRKVIIEQMRIRKKTFIRGRGVDFHGTWQAKERKEKGYEEEEDGKRVN